MGKAIVASFGFDEKFVVRAILRHGIGPSDEVVLVTGKPVDKTMKAYQYVSSLVSNAGAKISLVALDDKLYDFAEAVTELKQVLMRLASKHDQLTLIFSGGMRTIVLTLYTAALLLPTEVKEKLQLEIDTEDQGKLVTIPVDMVKLLNPVELGAKLDLLKVIVDNPGIDIRKAAKLLRKDETTVRRQLQPLMDYGLVRVEGKPLKLYPAKIAKMFL